MAYPMDEWGAVDFLRNLGIILLELYDCLIVTVAEVPFAGLFMAAVLTFVVIVVMPLLGRSLRDARKK